MKFIKGARTWRSILGTHTFFWPLTHPPPPRCSINQPLSKGLDGAPWGAGGWGSWHDAGGCGCRRRRVSASRHLPPDLLLASAGSDRIGWSRVLSHTWDAACSY